MVTSNSETKSVETLESGCKSRDRTTIIVCVPRISRCFISTFSYIQIQVLDRCAFHDLACTTHTLVLDHLEHIGTSLIV